MATMLVCSLAVGQATTMAVESVDDTDIDATESGSGSTAEQVDFGTVQERAARKEWEERKKRSEDFRLEHLQTKDRLRSIAYSQKKNKDARAEVRAQCRLDIRKSSKFTKVATTMRCYRSELTLNLERLRKEREFVEQVPGISDDVRWLTLTRIDLLTDALSVVVSAIDSNLYESVEELQEAKANLLKNYRKPKWLMMVRVQADRMQTWNSSIVTRITTIAEEEDLTPEIDDQLLDALLCYSDAEEIIENVLVQQDVPSAQSALRSAQKHMRQCAALLREAHALYQEFKPVETEEVVEEESLKPAAEPQISRRLLRRLHHGSNIWDGESLQRAE